jgi:hypothetical protein
MRIESLEASIREVRDLIEKAKSAEYIIADEPPNAIPKFEFYSDLSRIAENRSYAEAQTRYFVERGDSYLGKLENLLERYKNLRSYYINQLVCDQTAGGTSAGSSGSETPSYGGGSGDIAYLHLKDGRPKVYWATEDPFYRDRYKEADPQSCKVRYSPDPRNEAVHGSFQMSWDRLPTAIGAKGLEWKFTTEILTKPRGNDGCGIKVSCSDFFKASSDQKVTRDASPPAGIR